MKKARRMWQVAMVCVAVSIGAALAEGWRNVEIGAFSGGAFAWTNTVGSRRGISALLVSGNLGGTNVAFTVVNNARSFRLSSAATDSTSNCFAYTDAGATVSVEAGTNGVIQFAVADSFTNSLNYAIYLK